MRNFVLFALACVAVTESKAEDVKTILLKESIDSINSILKNSSEGILDQNVTDVFKNLACSEGSLCRAAVVLKDARRNNELNMLRRRLYSYSAYIGHQNCTVQNADEYFMPYLLSNLKRCCQNLLRQKKHR